MSQKINFPTFSAQRSWWISLGKFAVLILLGWAIYHRVLAREDITEIWLQFQRNINGQQAQWIWLAICLVPFNWILETEKWRSLLRPHLHLSFARALRAVLSGISLALFTPNRIGDYGGRILWVPSEHIWRALTATLISSTAQWVALLLGGGWGLILIGSNLWPQWLPHPKIYGWIWTGVCVLLPLGFLHLPVVVTYLQRLRWLRRWAQYLDWVRDCTTSKLLWVLSLAILRYLLYSSQYLFLLYGFGIEIPPMLGLGGVALIFLLQSSIPLPPFMGLVARGELAILLWSSYGGNELSILAATFTLFIINLVAPALLGGAAIVRIKGTVAHRQPTVDDLNLRNHEKTK